MIELCFEYFSVRCIWVYLLVMSRTRFRVNPHFGEIIAVNTEKKITLLSRNTTNKACQVNFDEMTFETCYRSVCQEWWTLGSDDLTVSKCFRVIFSLEDQIIQISLSLDLYFQQKTALKLSICHLLTKRSVWIFDVTNRRNDFYDF